MQFPDRKPVRGLPLQVATFGVAEDCWSLVRSSGGDEKVPDVAQVVCIINDSMPTLNSKPGKRSRDLPATQRVEAHLRKAIFAGKLRPRQRIIEGDLAEELSMSRGPVREALLRLERDGLVVTTSRRERLSAILPRLKSV